MDEWVSKNQGLTVCIYILYNKQRKHKSFWLSEFTWAYSTAHVKNVQKLFISNILCIQWQRLWSVYSYSAKEMSSPHRNRKLFVLGLVTDSNQFKFNGLVKQFIDAVSCDSKKRHGNNAACEWSYRVSGGKPIWGNVCGKKKETLSVSYAVNK